MRTIFAVLYLLVYFIIGMPVLGVMWIWGKFNKPQADLIQLRIVQWGFRCILWIGGIKVKVYGKENIPDNEAVLYIGNHRGIMDVLATYTQCKGVTGYIAKDAIEKVPCLRLWMRRLHCIFINRDDIKQSLKVILSAIDEVKAGVSICIFPEGTRNKDAKHPEALLPFKDGSFKIAQKTGCKIVPMAITGTAEVFEQHLPWIHKGEVTVTYGAPIVMADLDKEDQKRIGAYCQGVVSDMLKKQLNI